MYCSSQQYGQLIGRQAKWAQEGGARQWLTGRTESYAQFVLMSVFGLLILAEAFQGVQISATSIAVTGDPALSLTAWLYVLFLGLVEPASGILRFIMDFGGDIGSVIQSEVVSRIEEKVPSDESEGGVDDERADGSGEEETQSEPERAS